MLSKEILGLVASFMAAGISLSYIYTMVRGQTRPHLYSLAVDALLTTIAFLGALAAGAGAGAWSLGVSVILIYVMLVLCFWYGTKDVTPLDAVFALSAVFAIVPWLLTKDPTWSVVLTSLINILSLIPTFRKTWNDPYSEPWTIWGVNALKHVVAIAATAMLSLATLAYPISTIAVNGVFVLMVLYRRKRIPPKHAPAFEPSVPL